MIEIRIHGRGGQGGVTLAKIIATIRFLAGDSVQAFGLYAAERSGAPLQAFCRYDREPITNRNLIYRPDHVIVLDPTLIGPPITEGLKAGGLILLNAPEPPESFAERFPLFRLATVDATAIARDNRLGTRSVPIVNTALAGAVARMLGPGFDLASCHAALEHLGFIGGNLTAATQAYQALRLADEAGPAPRPEPSAAPGRGAVDRARTPGFLGGAGGDPPGILTGQWATEQPRRCPPGPPRRPEAIIGPGSRVSSPAAAAVCRGSAPASGRPSSPGASGWCRPATTSARRATTSRGSSTPSPATRSTRRWRSCSAPPRCRRSAAGCARRRAWRAATASASTARSRCATSSATPATTARSGSSRGSAAASGWR